MRIRVHPDAEKVLKLAIRLQNEALGSNIPEGRAGYDSVHPFYVFLAIIKLENKTEAGRWLLSHIGGQSSMFRFILDKYTRDVKPTITPGVGRRLLATAAGYAGGNPVTSVDLLMAAAYEEQKVSSTLRMLFNIGSTDLGRMFHKWHSERRHLFLDVDEDEEEDDDRLEFDFFNEEEDEEIEDEEDTRFRRMYSGPGRNRKKQGDTLERALSFITQYGRDLTEAARKKELDPLIGRRKELEEIIEILGRRLKSNPLLIGNPGVGKTMIVYGLAQKIASGDVPSYLEGTHIIELATSSLVAGTKYRGEFEDRLRKVIELASKYRDKIILFFDEIHTLIGAGSAEGALDAANILKPALASGAVRVIGATTFEDYTKRFERDSALVRRFVKVQVDEPSEEEAVRILLGTLHLYKEHYKVDISPDLVRDVVRLSKRYIFGRYLPDKAVDVLDRACSKAALEYSRARSASELWHRAHEQMDEAFISGNYVKLSESAGNLMEVSEKLGHGGKAELRLDHVLKVVSDMSGVPVHRISKDEREMLKSLERLLKKRVVGQDQAVEKVAKAVRRGRLGIRNPKRPVAVFLFVGPTGVGKTELARALAEVVYGSEESMIRLDMSEYMEQHSVSKLFGSPPGYVGYGEGGQLTEAVRKRPYSLILLDEIEKAHPRVWDAFLQVFEDGVMTDSQGRKVDFRNTIIIMTSNVGTEKLRRGKLGFVEMDDVQTSAMLEEEVKRTFRPEFLNRVDEVVFFRPLRKEDLRQILYITIGKYRGVLDERGIDFVLSERMEKLLLEKGFDPEYGARPIRRALDEYLFNPIADYYIEHGEAIVGRKLFVDWDPEERRVKISVLEEDKDKVVV